MVSEKQLAADKRIIEDNAYAKASKTYESSVAELKRQLKEKTISEKAYKEEIERIKNNYDSYILLIEPMAERYAMTDYKGMSDLNRKIQECIENAELERADSLINSKGDIDKREHDYYSRIKSNQQIADLLDQSTKIAELERNDLAADYYNKHTIHAAKFQNDSAAYWLERRAKLDTSNIEWTIIAGQFIDDYLADYSRALTYYERALDIANQQFESPNQWTAMAMNNIGSIYGKRGNYDEALRLHFKALEIDTIVLGVSHKATAKVLNNIGFTYYEQGDFNKALDYYFKTLYIEKQLDDMHPNIARTYNNIGLAYYELQEYKKAISFYLSSIEIREKVLGQNHYLTAQSYNNIGAAFVKNKEYEIGTEYILKAIEIYERTLGENHPSTASSYNNIGRIYEIQSKYEQARFYLTKALNAIGPDDPHAAFPYNNIASTYYQQGDYGKAVEFYSKALSIFEKISPDHPNTKATRDNYEKSKEALRQQEHN